MPACVIVRVRVSMCVCVCAALEDIAANAASISSCIINELKFLVVSCVLLELHINYAHTYRHPHTGTAIQPHLGAHIMRCLFARQAVIIIMIIIAVILIMHC